MPYVDLNSFRVDAELFRSIPVDWMIKYGFVPESRTEKVMTIICADPADVVRLDELEMLVGVPLRLKVGSRAAIADILQKSESSQRVLDEATEDFRMQLVSEDEEGAETLTIDRIAQDASPIIKLVDSVVFNAIQRRASDIHIETQEHVVLIKYRIDGVLYQAMDPIDKRHHGTIISRIKVMSELDIAEKRIPQDGRFKLRVRGRTIDFRVSIMPTVHGEDSVIRILDKESANAEFKSLNLEVVGFDAETKKKLRKFIREPYGMVLVTGPTGSGKTTTLYACLSEIQSVEDKIVTIEDPVEYQLRGITQIPGQREEGPDVRARAALDPPPRPRQDHGRRDPRRGDGPDRRPVGADRPPRVHDRPREQRRRRARPLPQHEGRALQLRLGAELRPRAAARAQDLRPLQGEDHRDAGGAARGRPGPRDAARTSTSTRARAASSATAPASTAAWRSPSCWTSPTASAG